MGNGHWAMETSSLCQIFKLVIHTRPCFGITNHENLSFPCPMPYPLCPKRKNIQRIRNFFLES
ncbi:hypothetical protein FDUTEX481_02026 [Tolypothrix sp. PCC 7601]|nr:hypothetical protein FDUTEX481_02026 [Tolypothrix sp. PCC 7601]